MKYCSRLVVYADNLSIFGPSQPVRLKLLVLLVIVGSDGAEVRLGAGSDVEWRSGVEHPVSKINQLL